MNIKKAIKYTLIAIPLLLLAKFGIEKVIYDSNKVPKINPHPIQKVRIHGQFPFDKNVTLSHFAISYANNNPECNIKHKAFGIFTAAETSRQAEINVSVARSEDNKYEAYYYQDYFLPGPCKWTFDRFVSHIEAIVDSEKLGVIDGGYSRCRYDRHPDQKAYFEFSNTLTYDCHINKRIRPDSIIEKDLFCESRSKNGKFLSPYENAKDVEQNYIYTKEVTTWVK
jgi:hypothetical protein